MGTESFLQDFRVSQISEHKRIVPDSLSMPCLEVIVDNRFVTMAFQLLNDMASDVSSPSGDKYGRNMRDLSIWDNPNNRKIIRASEERCQ
jgi:hypothetical protein